MSGPPDKSIGVATSEFADVRAFATAISNAALQGFVIPEYFSVPDPHNSGGTWVIFSDYTDNQSGK